MSEEAIQRKLWMAYGKVAQKLGRPFEVYRSAVLTVPIQLSTWIFSTSAAFSQDDSYNSPLGEGLSIWRCWIDGNLDSLNDLQQGDFLHNTSTLETYFIGSVQRHLPIQAIKAPSRISINRVGYSNPVSGFTPGDTLIAEDVPCWIQEPGSGGSDLGYIPAASYGRDALQSFSIYLWDPVNDIQIRDSVTDENNVRSQVVNIMTNELGTHLTTQVYQP